ncbi:metal-dependent transcriptional regulator, partial [Trichococcus sp.]|uniref:metal-dependent transcriptional regulator n=1 Tax=Trichococcus sp. TaxID=1985464 RepID=UPI003C7DE44D
MSPHKEDYLKVIMELGGDQQMINNKQIGKALSVSAASVTEMSAKLLKDGLISHIPYQGVQINEKGQLIANKLIRKHRLWEVFLADKLGFNWDEVHEEAEMLEHVSSDRLINSLDSFLGSPKYDPHGGVIPDKEGRIEVSESKPLIELEVGSRFVIQEVDDDQEFLAYLLNKDVKLSVPYLLTNV